VKKFSVFLVAMMTLFISCKIEAFSIIGPRPLGMGGAFVAVADGASAAYWNPAGLVQVESFEVLPFIGVSAVDHLSDFIEEINDFNDNPPVGVLEFPLKLNDILKRYDKEGIAAFGNPAAMLFMGKKPLAVSLMGLGFFGVEADLDLRPQYIVDDDTPGNGYGWDDNESAVLLDAIATTDIVFSYAWELTPKFSLGGSFKYLIAQKYDNEFSVSEEIGEAEEGSAWLDKVTEEEPVDGNGFGFDLGCLFRFNEKWRAGLLLRNLIEPKIKWEDDSEDTKLSNQIRVGIAWTPFEERLTLALDADLNKEEILTEERQQISLGLEWWAVKNRLALRVGTYSNNGAISDNSVLTGGLGLCLGPLHIDLAGGIDSSQEEAAVSGSLSLKL
jgi:hypothetical protein